MSEDGCSSFNLEKSLQYLKRKQLGNDLSDFPDLLSEVEGLEKLAFTSGNAELSEEISKFKNMILHNRAHLSSPNQSVNMSLLLDNIFKQFNNKDLAQTRPYGIEDNAPKINTICHDIIIAYGGVLYQPIRAYP
jgi:hypothetical protein